MNKTIYLKAQDKYVEIHNIGCRVGITSESLTTINKEHKKLWSVHRKYLVNPHHIKGKVGVFTNCELILSEGNMVPVSRRNYRWVVEQLKQLVLNCPTIK